MKKVTCTIVVLISIFITGLGTWFTTSQWYNSNTVDITLEEYTDYLNSTEINTTKYTDVIIKIDGFDELRGSLMNIEFYEDIGMVEVTYDDNSGTYPYPTVLVTPDKVILTNEYSVSNK